MPPGRVPAPKGLGKPGRKCILELAMCDQLAVWIFYLNRPVAMDRDAFVLALGPGWLGLRALHQHLLGGGYGS